MHSSTLDGEFGPRHRRAARQALPQRILDFARARVVAAVELVDGPQIGAEGVAARAAGQQPTGQDDAIIVARPIGGDSIELGRLGGDIAAPRLAVEDRSLRLAEGVPDDLAQVVSVGAAMRTP